MASSKRLACDRGKMDVQSSAPSWPNTASGYGVGSGGNQAGPRLGSVGLLLPFTSLSHSSLPFILGLQSKLLPGWPGPLSSGAVCGTASGPVPMKCRTVKVRQYSCMVHSEC